MILINTFAPFCCKKNGGLSANADCKGLHKFILFIFFIFLIENLNSNIQLWDSEDYSVLNKYIIIYTLRETKRSLPCGKLNVAFG